MSFIIYVLLLGFVFPGHSIPVIPPNRIPEKSMAPIVHVDPPIPGNSVILNCFVRDSSPEYIDMQGLKNGQAIPENEYVNTQAVKEKIGDSHFAFPKLPLVTGDIYTCVVVHKALK